MARAFFVDRDECISCGACVDNCPDVFGMDDDNLVEILNPEGASEEDIQEAMDACPVTCIHWEDEE